jgi:hypothetical protein
MRASPVIASMTSRLTSSRPYYGLFGGVDPLFECKFGRQRARVGQIEQGDDGAAGERDVVATVAEHRQRRVEPVLGHEQVGLRQWLPAQRHGLERVGHDRGQLGEVAHALPAFDQRHQVRRRRRGQRRGGQQEQGQQADFGMADEGDGQGAMLARGPPCL